MKFCKETVRESEALTLPYIHKTQATCYVKYKCTPILIVIYITTIIPDTKATYDLSNVDLILTKMLTRGVTFINTSQKILKIDQRALRENLRHLLVHNSIEDTR